jgi:hypothetical protein
MEFHSAAGCLRRHILEVCFRFRAPHIFFPFFMYAAIKVGNRCPSPFRLPLVFVLLKMSPAWLSGYPAPMFYPPSVLHRIYTSIISMEGWSRPVCSIANCSLRWRLSQRLVKVWQNLSSKSRQVFPDGIFPDLMLLVYTSSFKKSFIRKKGSKLESSLIIFSNCGNMNGVQPLHVDQHRRCRISDPRRPD